METTSVGMTDTDRPQQYQLLIGGQTVGAVNGRRLETVSPFTGRVWADTAYREAVDVDLAVRAARAAFEGTWAR
jgi:aldehyde dehydrogenase (NAD+)